MWAGDKDFVNVDGFVFDLNTMLCCYTKETAKNKIFIRLTDNVELQIDEKRGWPILKKLMQERGHKV